ESLIQWGLYIDPEVCLLICLHSTCAYALSIGKNYTHALSHLQNKHTILEEKRKGLTALLKMLSLCDPKTIRTRPDGSPKHPGLKVYNSFACCQCPFKTIHLPSIRRH
ncbi:hypothetical protein B0T10DRAFT_370022, partial [Thelonectria olida]